MLMDSKKIILITGGIRSGKSRYALSLAQKITGQKIFIATAQPMDESMTARIKKHREERGDGFITVEEPLYLAKAMKAIPQDSEAVLIDCLTLWVNNLFYYFKDDYSKVRQQFDLFLEVLISPPAQLIIVTNEIGLGVTPENESARKFIDELGLINQGVAHISNEVILMVAGLPQFIKSPTSGNITGVKAHEPMDYSFTRNTAAQ